MKGRAKVLDGSYLEFIAHLQKIGELHSVLRMIHSLSMSDAPGCNESDDREDLERAGKNDLLFSFWQKGWIEIRERDRMGRDWHKKEYSLLVHLDEIADYYAQLNYRPIPRICSKTHPDAELLV